MPALTWPQTSSRKRLRLHLRRGPQVARAGLGDVRFELFGGYAQPAAIKIDRRAAHLLHIAARQPLGQFLAAPAVHLVGKPLAKLLRCGRGGVQHADDAPDIVAPLGDVDGRAPLINADRLADGEPVAEGDVSRHHGLQAQADLLDERQRFGHGELPERILDLGMERFRHRFDGLLPKPEKGLPACEMAKVHLVRDGLHRVPRLAARAASRLRPPGPPGSSTRWRALQRDVEAAEEIKLEQERDHDEKAGADHPIKRVALLDKPDARQTARASAWAR